MKQNLFYVLISNILFLIITLILNFILPKYVSVDTYSMIKTYSLYVSYAGFLHFGYNDGMYLKYGGKKILEINKKGLAYNFVNYLILIAIMFLVILFIGFLLGDFIIVAFAFGMVSYNILGYLKSLYQATGKFKLYGISLNAEKIIIFIFTILLIFAFKSDNYTLYVGVQAIVGWIISFVLFILLEKELHFIKLGRISIKEFSTNIKAGFVLMIGNFTNSLFTSLDRWFVKILLSSFEFAMYSFAASLEAIVNVFVSPITITMYNYFCKKHSVKDIKLIKKISLIYGFLVISIAYPAKFVLENYLTKYISSSNIIFYLFCAQLFYIIIKGIYINIYKAQKKQKKYLVEMIVMIFIGLISNIISYIAFKNNDGFAFATLLTSIIWLIICELKDKDYRFSLKEIVAILIVCSVYIFTGYFLNSIIGFVIYIIIVLLVVYFLINDGFVYGINTIKNFYNKIKNKKENK